MKIFVSIVCATLVGFFIIQLFESDFFRIDQVICYQDLEPCPADLWLEINDLVFGKNIVQLSAHKISRQIKEKLIEIDQVEIEKKLPKKLKVSLVRRKAIAVIEAKDGYYQVGYQGVVIAKLDQPSELPLVVNKELLVGLNNKKVESLETLASLNCLYLLLFKNIETRRIEITSHQILTIYLKSGPIILVAANKNLENQVDSLQLILKRAKIEGKKIKDVDLRFDKPIINFIPKA